MADSSNVKQLVKILIGAAWIDGRVQPEERDRLHRVAKAKGVAQDPEIYPLLYELVAVPPEKCYQWLQEYLGDRPSLEDYQHLVEEVSALIYSDGDVAIEEAKLLTHLQQLDPANEANQNISSKFNSVLKAIQSMYQSWVKDKQ